MRYETDLTDAQWDTLESLIPAPKPGGRPAKYERREIVNAIVYFLRSGCAWRHLPHDLPPWRIVYSYYWRWAQDGTLHEVQHRLRGEIRTKKSMQRSRGPLVRHPLNARIAE